MPQIMHSDILQTHRFSGFLPPIVVHCFNGMRRYNLAALILFRFAEEGDNRIYINWSALAKLIFFTVALRLLFDSKQHRGFDS
jgi:hypothetical protein